MSMCVSTAQARTKRWPRNRRPAFFPVNFHTKWLLWNVHVRFDCAGSHKMLAAELASGIFPVNFRTNGSSQMSMCVSIAQARAKCASGFPPQHLPPQHHHHRPPRPHYPPHRIIITIAISIFHHHHHHHHLHHHRHHHHPYHGPHHHYHHHHQSCSILWPPPRCLGSLAGISSINRWFTNLNYHGDSPIAITFSHCDLPIDDLL